MADLVPEPDRTLEDACDRVLIDTLPLGLRRAIWIALQHGVDPKSLLARVKGMLCHPHPNQRGHLTYLAVEAYVQAVVAGRKPDPHGDGPRES